LDIIQAAEDRNFVECYPAFDPEVRPRNSGMIFRTFWLTSSLVLTVVVGGELAIGMGAPSSPSGPLLALPRSTPAPQTVPRASAELMQPILARPLFAETRRMPLSLPAPSAPQPAAQIPEPSARLVGTIVAGGQRIALFDMPGGKAQAVTRGQSIEGWNVVTIDTDRVSLRAGDGRAVTRAVSGNATAVTAATPAIQYWHAPLSHHRE
jgi:hypothetical protein